MLRKGVTFQWMEQCNHAFKLLKPELVIMPTLQYPNSNKPFTLFTDASKYSYLRILHQKETPKMPSLGAQPNPYSLCFRFLHWNTTQKECYAAYQSIQKFAFHLTAASCTLYCDLKPLASFFTTGSPVLDRWALELQQFNIKFQHIQGKKNVVADKVSWLRTLGLHQDNCNEDVPITMEGVIETY